MAMVCPFEVSKFTVTSPSETKIKKLLPSLTASLAPINNPQHPCAFKFPWKQSRKTYSNVKHPGCRSALKSNSVKELYRLPHPLGGHLCSSGPGSARRFSGSALQLYTLVSRSLPPCTLIYIAKKCVHGPQQSCSVFQYAPNIDNWGQNCMTTVVHPSR